jgi:rubredoxin
MAKWKCKLCGFVYDEKEGSPDRGIDPGTSFSELSDAFKCPKCGVSKKMFKEVE